MSLVFGASFGEFLKHRTLIHFYKSAYSFSNSSWFHKISKNNLYLAIGIISESVLFLSWVNTHPFDLKFVAFCPTFSGDSYVEFQEKTISGEFFRNFVQTKTIIYQNLWNFALLSEILFWFRIALKKFRQVLSYVVCTQVRRHVHKQLTKRRYGGEKPGRFVFGKPVLFTLGLGLTTPYSLGILVWNFYQTFVTLSTEFWPRFEPRLVPQDWQ